MCLASIGAGHTVGVAAAEESDFAAQLQALEDRMQQQLEAKLQEQKDEFESQLEELSAQFEEELDRVTDKHDSTRSTLKDLAGRVMLNELAGDESPSRRRASSAVSSRRPRAVAANPAGAGLHDEANVEKARRSLGEQTDNVGIAIKSDDASVAFGAESDVQIRRSAASTVSVVGNLEVTGNMVGAAMANGTVPQRICVGHTPHMQWEAYGDENVYQDIDISQCNFSQTPEIFTSMSGTGWHWMATGMTSLYLETATSFRVYIHHISDDTHSIDYSETRYWSMNWMAIGI